MRAATRLGVTASIRYRARDHLMERRVFIAIVLSFLVLYMYQAYFAPPPPQQRKPEAAATQQTQAPAADGSKTEATAPEVAAPAPAPAPAAPAPQALVAEQSPREITVDTATVQAIFTNSGGRLLHWRLKTYRDNRGQAVDLVPSGLPPDEQLPFSLRVDQPELTARLNTALYRVDGDSNGHVDATHAPAALSFEFGRGLGGRHSRHLAVGGRDEW